jgi:hypothetical protein
MLRFSEPEISPSSTAWFRFTGLATKYYIYCSTQHPSLPLPLPVNGQNAKPPQSFTQRTNVLLPPIPENTSNPTSTNLAHFPHLTKCPKKTVLTLQCLFPYATKHAFLKKVSRTRICRRGSDRGRGRGHHDTSTPRCAYQTRNITTHCKYTLLFPHSTSDFAPFQKDVTQLTNVRRRRRRVRQIPKSDNRPIYVPARQVDTPKQLRYISCSVFGDHMSNRWGKTSCVMTSYVIVACIVELSRRRKMLILHYVKRSEPT